MKRRVAAIFRSYILRPWTLALMMLYGGVTVIALLVTLTSNGTSEVKSIYDYDARNIAKIRPTELTSWEDPIKFQHYKGFSIGRRDYKTKLNKDPWAMRNLEPWQPTFYEMDSATLQSLGRLTSIQTLELNGVRTTPELWLAIAQLKELRCLRISSNEKVDLESLPYLPTLELLSLGTVDPAKLGLLRNQPNLRSLEIQDSDFSNTNTDGATLHELSKLRELIINPKKIEALTISPLLCSEIQQLPNLRLIAIGERGAISASHVEANAIATSSSTPKSILFNNRIAESSLFFLFLSLMLTALFICILWTQLRYQLVNSAALLLPNFTKTNLCAVSISVLLHVACVSTFRICYFGANVLPAIVETALFVALFCFILPLSQLRFVAPFLSPIVIISMSWIPSWLPNYLDQPQYKLFLIGEYPAISGMLLLAAVGLFVFAMKGIANYPKWYTIENRIDESIIWGDAGRKTTELPHSQRSSKDLQRKLAKTEGRSNKVIGQLWNAGFERSMMRMVDFVATLPLALILLLLFSRDHNQAISVFARFKYVPDVLLFLGMYAVLAKTLFYMSRLETRRAMMQQEALLPIGKSLLRSILMTGLWVQVWPWLLVSLGSAILGSIAKSQLQQWPQMTTETIWLNYFHCLFSVVGVWGVCLFLFTLRSATDKRMVAYPVFGFWALGSLPMILQRLGSSIEPVSILELLLVFCEACVGIFLAMIAWNQIPQVEWGMTSEQ